MSSFSSSLVSKLMRKDDKPDEVGREPRVSEDGKYRLRWRAGNPN
jgi:hypothetical protein